MNVIDGGNGKGYIERPTVDFRRRMLMSSAGKTPQKCSWNVRLVLENDPRWKGILSYCGFSHRIEKRPTAMGKLAPGEWNEVRIRVQDNRIEHWLNGVRVVESTRGSERWDALIANSKFADWHGFGTAEEGYIALQDHGDRVWYRNIRIRRLGD